jgi:hypothetical protein
VLGRIALAGAMSSKGAGESDAWIARADAWGRTALADVGLCCSASPVVCDDANPCTIDACDATKACTHAALADGTTCGVGKICAAGSCK